MWLEELRGGRGRSEDGEEVATEATTLVPLNWGNHDLQIVIGGEVKVDVRQEFGEGIGSSLWPSSVVLGRHLLRAGEGTPSRILELGSGCGLTAATLSFINAGNFVIATDKRSVLPLLQANVDSFLNRMVQAGRAVGSVQVQELDWFAYTAGSQLPEWGGHLDLIVLSDCLYSSASVGPLVNVLTALLACPGNERTRVLLANERRTALDEFLSACRRGGEAWQGREFVALRTPERDLSIVPGLVVPVVVMATQK